jgi:hypothetical protein
VYEIADRLVKEVEQGRLGRREAVSRLVAVAAAAFAGSTPLADASTTDAEPTFRAVGLNHIALNVSDVPRSREFYQEHLGLNVLRESASNAFLGVGRHDFVALFRSSKPGMNHYAYTIENYDAARTVERLKEAGLEPERQENRVYFQDPDDLTVQLSPERGD